MTSRIVIALGGNALGNTAEEQKKMIDEACPSLVDLISDGHEIIITHGNGPQVGMINLAFDESSKANNKISKMPLPECCAMSQGYIGYHLQQGIMREITKRKMPWHAATMITQIEVDPNDSAFENPTKPIGGYYSEKEAKEIMAMHSDIKMKEEAGKGYRVVVPSPKPVNIIERDSILNLLDNEFIVIACGGGGIPVIKQSDGSFKGIPAVIDKDFAAAKLAEAIEAKYLFILTAVDNVCINFGKDNEKQLTEMTVSDAEKYMQDGQFAPGSMLPKVAAACSFAKSGKGREAVIASLKNAPLAVSGKSGTRIYE